jgi:hypothetical protein
MLEPVVTEWGTWRWAPGFGHHVRVRGRPSEFEERKPDIVVVFESNHHFLAYGDIVRIAIHDVGGQADVGILGQCNDGDHIGRGEVRVPLMPIDGEADDGAPAGHHGGLPLAAPADRTDGHRWMDQGAAFRAALNP